MIESENEATINFVYNELCNPNRLILFPLNAEIKYKVNAIIQNKSLNKPKINEEK